MELDGHMMYWGRGPSGPIRFPVYGVLIDHAEGKFLFDSGFDKTFIDAMIPGNAIQSKEQTLAGQLDRIGLACSDVTHVVNSHFHVDHVGGNKCCIHATTICHKCELESASDPDPFEEMGYADMSFGPNLRKNMPILAIAPDVFTPRFETLVGDQEIAKGVTLVETPGHTPGHYSLLVRLAQRRPMLFTGDACYTHRSLTENLIAGSHVDVRESFKSLQRLRDLSQEHDAELFYSHDAASWASWLPAPGYYD
jgi:4-pyridoxolactonase